ncbi:MULTISPECIES: thermonuclease family protein [Paenibacillus]|jgi:micrococcal nuclease|uniref:TNase-like domain-containing protein n=1 Tax=Paenibacillus odorifer TaxID=189426 RepID=A0ABX3GNJ2_9BACL|nr:thermonuclease family protein [Paenibacillus odorifer]OMC76824.1 hypothetical protein BK125_17395 [Paenibacillus odorifer]OMD27201.1 hypothetical protein BSO21_20200 [Paenibacillus odorifer]
MLRSKKFLISLSIIALIEILIFTGISFRDAIAINFFLISFVAIPIWIIGLIKPSLIIRWGDPTKKTRKAVTTYSLITIAISLILFVVTIPKVTTVEQGNSVAKEKIVENVNKTESTEKVSTSVDTKQNIEPASLMSSAETIEVQVISVTDGDTFTVKLQDGTSEKVRLILIDTPETKHPSKPVQPFGLEASAYTAEILTGKTVKLEYDVSERDKYGRILAYAYVGDKMVNEMLLEKGLARVAVYQPDVKYVDQFREIQKKAQSAKLGIWSIEDYATDKGYDDTVVAKVSTQPTATVKPSPKPVATLKPVETKKPAAQTKKPTAAPTKKPTATPQPVQDVYYKNCSAVRAAGADPIYAGDPGYSRKLDRDGDGIGCE